MSHEFPCHHFFCEDVILAYVSPSLAKKEKEKKKNIARSHTGNSTWPGIIRVITPIGLHNLHVGCLCPKGTLRWSSRYNNLHFSPHACSAQQTFSAALYEKDEMIMIVVSGWGSAGISLIAYNTWTIVRGKRLGRWSEDNDLFRGSKSVSHTKKR